MKTKSTIILTVLTGILIAMQGRAQTNTQTTIQTIQGVGSTIGSWFSSENPANRFQDAQTWAGVVNQNNSPVANEVGASYDLWRSESKYFPYTAATNQPSTSLYLALEGRERTSGVGIMSAGAGPQFGWMQNDIRIGVFVEPVYRLDQKRSKFRAEFGLTAEKMLTPNTAIGLLLSQQTHEKTPFVGGQFTVSFGNGTGFLGLFNKAAPDK
jgi:hypothetical protein